MVVMSVPLVDTQFVRVGVVDILSVDGEFVDVGVPLVDLQM